MTDIQMRTKVSRRRFLGVGLAAGGTVSLRAIGAETLGEPGKANGNSVLGGTGGLHHVGIRTNDWDRTVAFYEKGLGFTVKMIWRMPQNGADVRFGYFDSGDGSCVEILEDPFFVPSAADSQNGPLHHICLRTVRFEEALENALKHGAKVVGGPGIVPLKTITGQGDWIIRTCKFSGPNGEWIQLLENAP
jgi:glyoxylase I family protein